MGRCELRSKGHHRPENHERWLVSYADFITLLFAFFVVMFASSQMNKKRMESLSEAYSQYIEDGTVTPPASPEPKESPPALGPETREMLTMAEMRPVQERIEQLLSTLIEDEKIAVELLPRGLVLSLREASFFDPGEETLRLGAKELLRPVEEALLEVPHQSIRLEGHTDDVPIHNYRFASNWELSTARAEAVLDFMLQQFPIAANRMSVAGYAEYRPVEDNNNIQGRAANRRVDVVILSQAAAEMAPKQRWTP